MSFIKKITPINLEAEKEKFFASGFQYNPQFRYQSPIQTKTLIKYGLPQPDLVRLAQKILDANQKKYPSRQALFAAEGPIINYNQAVHQITLFLKMHRLEKRYQVVVDAHVSSTATATSNLIKIHPDAQFRTRTILSTIYHEIGTHVLRRINYEQQPWYKKKKKYGLTHNYLKTEEGLAVIHGHLPKTNKLVHNAALKYIAIDQAQKLSFVDLFRWASQYRPDPIRNWRLCVRLKRGLTDTSKPGGLTKDLVYFGGFVKVWRWLYQHNFEIDDLYYGKLAIEDLPIAKQINPNYRPVLPSFYLADKKEYQQKLKEIGQANFLF